jgi:CRP-like cAMP-binding protein
MAIPLEKRVAFLKQRQIFKEMDEAVLEEIAGRMDEYWLEADKNLFRQGDPGSVFYFIYSGSARVWTIEDGEERDHGFLETGDKLGEEALLMGRPRQVSVTTREETTFLVMHKSDFERMLERYPAIEDYLFALMETRQAFRRNYFPWLHKGEIVQIMSRRHPIQLALRLTRPVALMMVGWFFIYLSSLIELQVVPSIIGWFILALTILWGGWEVLDWRNDFFILTNQRVVWLEQVLLQAAARREAPLAAVQSVDVRTSLIGRIFDFGDLLVRTYTGTGSLTLTNVDHPKQMKAEIEELLLRVRKKTEVTEEKRLRQAIRQSLGMEAEDIPDPVFHLEEPEEEKGPFFKFLQTREVSSDGRTITYHRHWLVLLYKTWLPLLGMAGLIALMFYAITTNFVILTIPFPPVSFILFWFFGQLILAGIALYHFADWNNDIYKITKDDMLIDSEKKPFGEEISRSAPIKNIISLEHNRIGLIRLILNFGNVRVVVADETLLFIDVHNPAQVQQDIYYRQEQIKFQREEKELEDDRQHISRWLRAYHEIREEKDAQARKQFAADFDAEEDDL